jgi:alkanesulfonate monooxygenase SsuD/methylene tetrahydromethanopterin reductase-like flavin-dependent oxidoreductase (luciferase family)
LTVLEHYGFNRPEQFKGRKGYEYYQEGAKAAAALTEDQIAEDFLSYHIWGTPEQCYEKMMKVREHIGCTGYNTVFKYADMPYEEAERNVKLFASEVIPELAKVPDPEVLAEAAE